MVLFGENFDMVLYRYPTLNGVLSSFFVRYFFDDPFGAIFFRWSYLMVFLGITFVLPLFDERFGTMILQKRIFNGVLSSIFS